MAKKIPKLRFKEFNKEWAEKKLKEVLNYEQPTKYIIENTDYKDG
jgi:type I restriction enzyme S subunit